MINRFIIFQTENPIVFQLINTERYETKFQIPHIFPNIEPLCSLGKCPMSRACISICFPVPSIVLLGAP